MSRKEGPLSSEAQQASARRREKDARRQDAEDLRAILELRQGRRFLYRLIFRDLHLFNGYAGHDAGVYRHLGRQDAARELLLRIQDQEPELYERMVLEHTAGAAQKALERLTTTDLDEEHEPNE